MITKSIRSYGPSRLHSCLVCLPVVAVNRLFTHVTVPCLHREVNLEVFLILLPVRKSCASMQAYSQLSLLRLVWVCLPSCGAAS